MLRNMLLFSGKRCLSLVLAFFICSSLPAYAIERPDAGQIADSVKERKNVVIPKTNVKIEVNKEQKETSLPAEGLKFKVNGFHITGQTVYSEDKLQALVQDSVGRELTLAELQTVAGRIGQYFNDRGYMVANAYIPAQKIKNGIVDIIVVPGRYGNLDLRNHSKLSNRAANRSLSRIKPGDYVKKDLLERTLLLMSDMGGISIQATLVPGKTNGTSDLIVEINDTKELTSEYSLDNYGNRFTGEDRGILSLNFNNIRGQGDVVTIGGYNSGGGLTNFNFNYVLPVGNRGARVGAGYNRVHYSLGEEFTILDANGTAKNTGIFALYPLVRSRSHNLYAQIEYDHRRLEDNIYDYVFIDKHINAWTFTLNGDNQDNFHGWGVNNFTLAVVRGQLGFDGGRDYVGYPAQTDDKLTANTAGSYTKLKLDFNRLQYLNKRLNLYFGFTGQLASKNLDSSEKLFLGGANGVKAYPQGEASGDRGYLLTGELRWNMPSPIFQVAAFIDNGHVTVNKNPWPSAGGPNSRSLTSAGLGFILNSARGYTIRVDYAWKINSGPATADTDKRGRLWLKGTRYF